MLSLGRAAAFLRGEAEVAEAEVSFLVLVDEDDVGLDVGAHAGRSQREERGCGGQHRPAVRHGNLALNYSAFGPLASGVTSIDRARPVTLASPGAQLVMQGFFFQNAFSVTSRSSS